MPGQPWCAWLNCNPCWKSVIGFLICLGRSNQAADGSLTTGLRADVRQLEITTALTLSMAAGLGPTVGALAFIDHDSATESEPPLAPVGPRSSMAPALQSKANGFLRTKVGRLASHRDGGNLAMDRTIRPEEAVRRTRHFAKKTCNADYSGATYIVWAQRPLQFSPRPTTLSGDR